MKLPKTVLKILSRLNKKNTPCKCFIDKMIRVIMCLSKPHFILKKEQNTEGQFSLAESSSNVAVRL